MGVEDSKNVIVFHPLLTGHVIRRRRSGRVRIFNGNLYRKFINNRFCACAVQMLLKMAVNAAIS